MDRERCTAAAVPEDIEFATKPRLAQRMIERALTAGVPVSWVLGDEGNDRRLRLWLEQHERPHVLAVKATEPLWALVAGQGAIQVPAKDLATAEPLEGWRRLSAGAGSKGERLYDWARFRLFRLQQAPTGCWCAASSPSRTRWHITSCSARPPPAWRPDRRSALAGRGVLRDGQAGGRAGRLRGAQLARLVPAHHLIDAGARLPGGDAGRTRLPKGGGRSSAFIAFSMPEIRRLITRFQVSVCIDFILAWSLWRRVHQTVAKACHWKQQTAKLLIYQ